MNTKVILILVILFLNLLMLCLINKNKLRDGFFYQSSCDLDCSKIDGTTTKDRALCNEIPNCFKESKPGTACKNKCHFDPRGLDPLYKITGSKEVIPSQYNKASASSNPKFGGTTTTSDNPCTKALLDSGKFIDIQDGRSGAKVQCVSKSGRLDDGFFPDHKDNGTYTSCYDFCKKYWDGDKIRTDKDGAKHSKCEDSDCIERCQDYLYFSGSTDTTSYRNYPEGRISDADYKRLRADLINELETSTAFKTDLKDNLFTPLIKSETDAIGKITSENEKLGEIMDTLKNLNNTGNSFIQQVDQLGEFQDKYSERIESILDARQKDKGNVMETKIQQLNQKMSTLDELYETIMENTQIKNLGKMIEKPYRQISTNTSSGEVKLSVHPLLYKAGGGDAANSKKYNFKREGAYLIKGQQSGHSYLYYSQTRPGNIDGSDVDKIICDPGDDAECNKWKFGVIQTESNAPEPSTTVSGSGTHDGVFHDTIANLLSVTQNELETSWQTNLKRDFYFYIHLISNIDEYNSLMIKTQGTSGLISSTDSIQYPFYIIESVRRPGYVVKVKPDSKEGEIKLYIDKANNSPEEKFTNAGTEPVGTQCPAV